MLAAFTLRTPFAGFGKAVAASESALVNDEATSSTLVGRAITGVRTSFITPVVEPVATAPAPTSYLLAARRPPPTILYLDTDPWIEEPVEVEPSLFNPRAGPYRSPISTKLNLILDTHIKATKYPEAYGPKALTRWQLAYWQRQREGAAPSWYDPCPSTLYDTDEAMWL